MPESLQRKYKTSPWARIAAVEADLSGVKAELHSVGTAVTRIENLLSHRSPNFGWIFSGIAVVTMILGAFGGMAIRNLQAEQEVIRENQEKIRESQYEEAKTVATLKERSEWLKFLASDNQTDR